MATMASIRKSLLMRVALQVELQVRSPDEPAGVPIANPVAFSIFMYLVEIRSLVMMQASLGVCKTRTLMHPVKLHLSEPAALD